MNAWSEKWLLKFHPEKCKTMRIGKSKVNEYKYRLKSDMEPMQISSDEKDLGAVIDNKLNFHFYLTHLHLAFLYRVYCLCISSTLHFSDLHDLSFLWYFVP